ncbi:MAG: TIGR03545 family protein, partial [Bacteriovoracia bacterium]
MTDATKKVPKKKGPIRFEAIIPVAVISAAAYGYFTWYFDQHLRSGIEYVATQANSAEVNVAAVRTSFLRGTFDLDGLQVTEKELPQRNLLAIDNIHFGYLWDALLRMKFVVNEASINQIQVFAPRAKPGFVLPPEPETPSKLEAMQQEVIAQVKEEYSQNMLGDLIALLEGADPKDQLQQIREELQSEKRVKAMIEDVETKRKTWDKEVKRLSDTSKVKELEAEINELKKEKNLLKQAQGIKDVTEKLKAIQKQAKEAQAAGKKLEGDVRAVANYPREIEALVKEDIASLKNRFQIPQLDLKDMAMALFSKELGQYIAQARKYQALATQYLPEKKEREEVVPPPRQVGRDYEFPITKGYPLFWLKKAAISSKGTKDSYSGNVSGELTNVTTSPKWLKKPTVLELRGDFPATQVYGVKATITADFTRATPQQLLDLRVNEFAIPGREFSKSEQLKFGFTKASGSTVLTATLEKDQVKMSWNATMSKPQWLVEAKSKLAQELLSGIVNGIPVVYVNGTVGGTWKNLNMAINSNLGDELSTGLKDQIGIKLKEAEGKLQALVDEKIKKPQQELLSQVNASGDLVTQIKNLDKLYKANEDKIKAEIEKLKKGGTGSLK